MYIVTVAFQIKPAHALTFQHAVCDNATASVHNEPGCHQFDVCAAADNPCELFLYEVYESEVAFQAHLDSVHFRAFNAQTASWVESKVVRTFHRL